MLRHGASSLHSAESGFSLLELFIVLVLLIVISVLYSGSFSAKKQAGMKSVCAGNLQKIYIALSLYEQEADGRFPAVENAKTSAQALAPLVPRYTSETRIFICPGIWEQKDFPAERFSKQTLSYSYYMGRSTNNPSAPLVTDRQVDTSSKAKSERLFSATGRPPGNNHDKFGGNVLSCDGQIQSIGTNAPVPFLTGDGIVLLNP